MNDNEQFTSHSNESDYDANNRMRSMGTALVISVLIVVTVYVAFAASSV